MPLETTQLATHHHIMEKFDFNANEQKGTEPQTNQTTIRIERDGTVNSITGYLEVNFGTEFSNRRNKKNNTGKTQTNGPSISSRAETENTASNWPNPVLILHTPIGVKTGDLVEISTKIEVNTTSPSYTITVRKSEANSGTWGPAQSIHLDYAALYPTVQYPSSDNTPRGCPIKENPLTHLIENWTRPRSPDGQENESTVTDTPTPPNPLEGNPRLECGGSKPRNKPKPKEKKIVTDLTAALRVNKSIRETPWYCTPMSQVVKHLLEEQTKQTALEETSPYFSTELENIVSRHLHLDGTVNEHIANVRVGSRWYATDKIQAAIGATCGGLEPFIKEHLTWIHPRAMLNGETDHQRLQELIKAVGASKRTRVAGLFELGDKTLEEITRAQERQVRACVITTFPPGALSTQHPQTKKLSIDMDNRKNTKTLRLILMEKGELNPIAITTLQTEIQNLINGCSVNISWSRPSFGHGSIIG